MSQLKTQYALPDDIPAPRPLAIQYQGLSFKLFLNAHANELINGQAILTENLYTFILQGYKEILHAGGRIRLGAGESAILKKGSYVVSERFEVGSQYQNLLIFFETPIIPYPDSTPAHSSTQNLYFRKLEACPLLWDCISTLAAYMKEEFSSAVHHPLLANKITEAFLLMQGIDKEVIPFFRRQHHEKTSSLTAIFEQHFKEPLLLSDYAHLCNCSLSTLKRLFKQETGVSPRQWITERRLEAAMQQLPHQGIQISEIAFDLGFESLSHFSRAFKKKYGKSPTHFRRELLG